MRIFQIDGYREEIIDLLGHRDYVQNFRQSWKISVEPRLSGSCLKFSWQKNKLPKAEWDAWGSSPPRRIYGALMATEITEGTI